MQNTAVVINDSLCSMTLGLQRAGFQVVSDYEINEKDLALRKTVSDVPAHLFLPEDIAARSRSEIDLLAVQMGSGAAFSAWQNKAEWIDPVRQAFLDALNCLRPRAFLLAGSPAMARRKPFMDFLTDIVGKHYQLSWQVVDTSRWTGFPVVEHKIFAVGLRSDIGEKFEFPVFHESAAFPVENCLELNRPADAWYFQISEKEVPQQVEQKRVYCWKPQGYTASDFVYWNNQKIPLIWTGGAFRKITHREVARLKGFPDDFALPETGNRQLLYTRLMYSCNVSLVSKIGESIQESLTGSPLQNRQVMLEARFEELFYRGLLTWADTGTIRWPAKAPNTPIDFLACSGGKTFCFELKYFRNNAVVGAKLNPICRRLSSLCTDGQPVLVVANEVSEALKADCWATFKTAVWDVGNLLWLFDKLPDVKNEFIALLDYAVSAIAPRPPKLELVRQGEGKAPQEVQSSREGREDSETQGEEETPLSWERRLEQIKPGPEKFTAYEELCVEILKFTLGEYLTLWWTQESSNDGLYRFDLCCKIKVGVNHDFFDTIKNYFNTKYIVFEFKNCSAPISQKEIYTTEKYLYEKALRKVAIIISRKGADEHALRAARGSLRENGKLILCLSDQDLLRMITIKKDKKKNGEEPADFLSDTLDDLLIQLEK